MAEQSYRSTQSKQIHSNEFDKFCARTQLYTAIIWFVISRCLAVDWQCECGSIELLEM